MRKIDEIIVHCSDSEADRDIGAATIDDWHRMKGWKCIGYHFVVRLDGTIENGRPVEQIGAHCKGHNAHSIGICYIGGRKNGKHEDTRTEKQKESLLQLISKLKSKYGVSKVVGHCNYNRNKACPCFDAEKEYG